MSRMRDIPHVVRHIGPWTFLKRLYHQTWEDNLLVWAAALAYSWLFALFPFLIFCLSLIPLLPAEIFGQPLKPSRDEVRKYVDAALVTGENATLAAEEAEIDEEEEIAAAVVPPYAPTTRDAGDPEVADVQPEEPGVQAAPITNTIGNIVDEILNRSSRSVLTISILIALFTASGGVAMTMAGLDKCYDVAPQKMRPLYKARPVAMLLTIVMAVMILLVVILLPVTDAVLRYVAHMEVLGYQNSAILWLINPLRYTLAILLLLGVLALVYRWGPSLKTRMHLFSPGSVFAVTMWILTGWAFRFYVDSLGAAATYEKTYGAVAGVAILMLLFYLDALFLLLGAEINAEIDFIRLGIRSGPLPEDQVTAPIPTYQLDDEDRELKAEIEDRRSVDVEVGPEREEGAVATPPAPPKMPSEPSAKPPATPD